MERNETGLFLRSRKKQAGTAGDLDDSLSRAPFLPLPLFAFTLELTGLPRGL